MVPTRGSTGVARCVSPTAPPGAGEPGGLKRQGGSGLRGSEPDALALAPGHVAHPFEAGAGLGLVAAADVAEHHLDQLRALLLVEAVLSGPRLRSGEFASSQMVLMIMGSVSV